MNIVDKKLFFIKKYDIVTINIPERLWGVENWQLKKAPCVYTGLACCLRESKYKSRKGSKMKTKRKLKILALLGATILGLSACGGSKEALTKETQSETVKELTAQERYEAMNAAGMEVNSMSANINMVMDLNMAGQKIATTTQMEMTSFTDPLKAKMIISMDMGEMGSQTMETYVELTEEDMGMVYIYDGAAWTKQEIPDLAAVKEQYDVQNSIGVYTQGIIELKEEGKEEISGKKAVKLSGKMMGEALKNTILETGSMDSFHGLLTEEQINSLYNGLEGESSLVEFWVDEVTNEMVKLSMDMTAVMDLIYKNMSTVLGAGEELTMGVNQLLVTIDNIHYNGAQDFVIPEEAKQ